MWYLFCFSFSVNVLKVLLLTVLFIILQKYLHVSCRILGRLSTIDTDIYFLSTSHSHVNFKGHSGVSSGWYHNYREERKGSPDAQRRWGAVCAHAAPISSTAEWENGLQEVAILKTASPSSLFLPPDTSPTFFSSGVCMLRFLWEAPPHCSQATLGPS